MMKTMKPYQTVMITTYHSNVRKAVAMADGALPSIHCADDFRGSVSDAERYAGIAMSNEYHFMSIHLSIFKVRFIPYEQCKLFTQPQ